MITKKSTLEEICSPIDAELNKFKLALKKELVSSDALIQSIHEHILKMTGKFLRPTLTLLSSRIAGEGAIDSTIQLAVAAELIHTATLVHDDIIDDSDFRRNQPSVHSRWGRDLSIVSGDYLYAKAFLILANLEDTKIAKAFAMCAHVMCEGEMKQIEKRKEFYLTEEEYFKIIHKKTAALFQASCMGGAYLSGNGLAYVEKLGEYGYALGMAFQIVDDCLDLSAKTEEIGKQAGLDLAKSDVTLPVLYLYAELEQAQKKEFLSRIQNPSQENLDEIRELAQQYGVFDKAMNQARIFAQTASNCLKDIPPSPARESLTQLVDYCLERGH